MRSSSDAGAYLSRDTTPPLASTVFSPPEQKARPRNGTNQARKASVSIDRMVFSSAWLAAAARVPAELCQGPPRPGQRRRLRADEVLRALFAPPVHELGRLADCLFVFFCLPLPEPDQYYYLPVSGRGGWMTRRPGVLYTYRRSLSVSSSSSSSSWTDSDDVIE